jgi:hypothetical protein
MEALRIEAGVLDLPEAEMADLAARIRSNLNVKEHGING